MRGVAVSLYARWRESLTPVSAVSPMQGVTYKNFKKDAESRILRVSPLRGVVDPAYSRCRESPAPSKAETGSPMPRMVNTGSRIAVGDLKSIHWTFKGLPVCFKRQLN